MFKDVYRAALGDKADQYQTVGFLVSSACAEVIADTLLCPWEAVSPSLPPPSNLLIYNSNLIDLNPIAQGQNADLRDWNFPHHRP